MKHFLQITRQKNGISLIAVLMFMLAATTASVVVFRMISSENFSSGARLKHSEANQAAESGLNAAQAWLSSKGLDVGALVGSYFPSKNPMNLTNQLGVMQSERGQRFNVYLMGIDTGTTNNAVHKFKILSVGIGRYGSEVKLAAIFDVDGLYKVQVPTGTKTSTPIDLPGYFGGSLSFSGDKRLTSATILGNWTGNPLRVDKDVVITGDLLNSGEGITIGGTACVGGKYDPNNGSVRVNDMYFGFSENFIGQTYGSVYSAGRIYTGSAGGANPIPINGNLTLNGELRVSNRNIRVHDDLTIYDNGYVAGGGTLTACGNVWSSNESGVRATADQGANIRFNWGINGESDNCPAKPGSILAFKGAVAATGITNVTHKTEPDQPVGFFNSRVATNTVPIAGNKPTGADDVKNYCDNIWRPTTSADCQHGKQQYTVDDPIASSLADIEAFLVGVANTNDKFDDFQCLNNATNTISCNAHIGSCGSNKVFPTTINGCYNLLKKHPAKLYNGYLVVRLNQDQEYSLGTVALDGKFIFIYNNAQGNVFVAPTTNDSRVMMFFKNGVTGEVKSAGCQDAPNDGIACTAQRCRNATGTIVDCNSPAKVTETWDDGCYKYNYFIYSLKQIKELNNWSTNCPLRGNFYFPSGSCAGVTNVNNQFRLEENQTLVSDLMDAGILCKRSGGTGDCTEQEIKNTQNGNPENGEGEETATFGYEDRWLAISSRLKVSMASKNISREAVPVVSNENNLTASVLVMPRIVRLAKDAYNSPLLSGNPDPLRRFYTFMYLNGANSQAAEPTRTCTRIGGSSTLPTTGELTNGFYRCTFNNQIYSPFYVIVKGENGGASVWLSPSPPDIQPGSASPDNCRDVRVIVTENMNEFDVNVSAISDNNANWTINPSAHGGCQVSGTVTNGWSISCPQGFNGETAVIFNACTNNNPQSGYFEFRLGTSNGINIIMPDQSRVKIATEQITITRTDMTSIVSCPVKGDSWMTLNCVPGGARVISPSNSWSCDKVAGISANYVITVPAGCKLPSGPDDPSATGLVFGVNNQVSEVSFEMDLAWRKHVVTVNGGTLGWATTDTRIPLGERSGSVSDGDSFEAYHGAIYTFSSNGQNHQLGCSATLSCNPVPPAFLTASNNHTGTIAPTGAGTITLSAIQNPPANCQQPATQKVGSSFTLGSVAPVSNISGYGCDVEPYPTVTYNLANSTTNIADISKTDNTTGAALGVGDYTITAKVACENRTSSINCGTLTISESEPATATCTWTNNPIAENQTARVTISVAYGDETPCNTAPTMSGLGGSWTQASSSSSTTGRTWVFTKSGLGSHVGSHNQGTVYATMPTGCANYPTTVECPAFEVKEASCEYQPSWCGGRTFEQVTTTSQNYGDCNGFNAPICVYATAISKMGNEWDSQGGYQVNGVKLTGNNNNDVGGRCGRNPLDSWGQRSCAEALTAANVQKADGGYYIYLAAGGGCDFVTTGGTPNCGGGTSSSSSAAALAITCAVAKTSVTQGENIGPPTISCSSGAMVKTQATFAASAGTLPSNFNNWQQAGNAYFPGSVTGNNTITVSNVTCGGTTVSGTTTCGTIAVNRPTCSGVSGTTTIGATVTPTVSCGTASLGNRTFSASGGNWTSNGTTGGSFGSASSTAHTLYLATAYCDGNFVTINNETAVSCGTITVTDGSGIGNLTNLSLPDCWNTKQVAIGNYSQTATNLGGCISNGICNLKLNTWGSTSTVRVNDGTTDQTLTISNSTAQHIKLKIPFDIYVSGYRLEQVGCDNQ